MDRIDMEKISKEEIITVIENALELEEIGLTIDSSSDDIEQWDSLGHLAILVALDELFSGKIGDIEEMATANSVKKIIRLLKDSSLI